MNERRAPPSLRVLEPRDVDAVAALELTIEASSWDRPKVAEELQHADATVIGAFDVDGSSGLQLGAAQITAAGMVPMFTFAPRAVMV